MGTEAQGSSDSLEVPLSKLRAEPQATWVHINPHPLPPHPGTICPGHTPGCYLGSHGLPLRLSVSESLSLSPSLHHLFLPSQFLHLYPWPLSLSGFTFPLLSISTCLPLSLPLFLSVRNCLRLSLCISHPSVSHSFLCPLSPPSSRSLSLCLSASPHSHLSVSLPLSLLYPFNPPSLPPPYPTQGSTEEPAPSPTCFPPPTPHGGREVEAAVPGCPPPSPAPHPKTACYHRGANSHTGLHLIRLICCPRAGRSWRKPQVGR